jgi:VanZ family protein
MRKICNILRWLPAIVLMAVIFGFSSIPSQKLPDLGIFDRLVKKSAHMVGYGLLALSFWYGMRFKQRYWWLALLLTLFYACSDEYHQSFVPGRHSSWFDVFVFDGGGAFVVLAAAIGIRRRKLPPSRTH